MLFFGISGYSQEFPGSEGISIGSRQIIPSLSTLRSPLPESKFTLREVNFEKEEKREINLIAIMERKRYEKESSYIELDSPVPTISPGEKALIQVTNDFRIHDRSSNYDIYTGKKKIPAYQEMKSDLFRGTYLPFSERAYIRGHVSPYRSSSFFR